jgi:23S rRNA (pseudouridine1915-N3)-methyltransferase
MRMTARYERVDIRSLKSPVTGSADAAQVRSREADALRAAWPKRPYPVALSEEGRLMDSRSFARWLGARRQEATEVVFCIGGAYGLDPGFKRECREVLSLSSLTFAHRLVPLVLAEQIYRASTILAGHPYHK